MYFFRPIPNSGVYRSPPRVRRRLFAGQAAALWFVLAFAQSVGTADVPTDSSSVPSTPPAPTLNAPPAHWYFPEGDSTLVLDTFDYPDHIGSFPEEIWEGRSGWRYAKTQKRQVYYSIAKEKDNYYLTAETEGEAVNFGREAKINLRLYQKLRWRWRVHSLPEGGDETDSEKNDVGASVRIIIGTSPLSARAIKYTWSTTLEPRTMTADGQVTHGTEIDDSRLKVIVLQSGPEKLGQWVWEEVDVYEDYRRLFGGDPRPMDVFSLLTDSDNTKTFVKADYDDIMFIIPRPVAVDMKPDYMLENP